MQEFYTNFVQDGSKFLVSGYRNGERFQDKVKYQPYLFVNAKKDSMSPYKTLDGRKVDRVNFDDIWAAKDYIKDKKDIYGFEIFGSEKFLYNYINDTYPGQIEYDPNQIRTVFIDIENLIPEEGGFPNPLTADQEITVITLEFRGKYYCFGTTKFDTTDPLLEGLDVVYEWCQDEQDLLKSFLRVLNEIDPDIISGWNVLAYDLTYLYNRIKKVLGLSRANSLSPWGKVDVNEFTKYNKTQTEITPIGRACLDYLDLYRKFSYSPQESYTLDHIAKEELGVGKLDHSEYENFNDFYRRNPQKYVCYNIIDVNRVVRIDDKMQLIGMVCSFAYDAKINYTDTFTTVLPWDCIITNTLMDDYIVVPQSRYSSQNRDIMGGFVKDVKVGMHPWTVAIDADSLYPHIQMYLNISPETLVDRIANVTPEAILNGHCREYIEDSKKRDLTFSGIGVRYHRKFQGVMPRIIEGKYNSRKAAKTKMLEWEGIAENPGEYSIEYIKSQVSKYRNEQQNKKIQINALFGASANPGFRYFDPNIAESITSTGQVIIQFAANVVNDYLNKVTGIKKDRILASDTDSVYFTLEDVVNKYRKPDWDDRRITEFCVEVYENAIIPLFIKKFKELAEDLNAFSSDKIRFKLEKVCPNAVFVAKKRNALYVGYNEGVYYEEPKIKITGIEAVRSSTPQICKDYIKKAFKIIMTQDENSLQKNIEECREDFFSRKFEQVAFPRGVQGLGEYSDKQTVYRKGTPIHVRASLLYNHLLDIKNINKYYPKISEGDKIKFIYLKEPNPIGSNVIASPINALPKELGLDEYIDFSMQFEKTFLGPIQNVLDCFGWNTEKQSTLAEFFG